MDHNPSMLNYPQYQIPQSVVINNNQPPQLDNQIYYSLSHDDSTDLDIDSRSLQNDPNSQHSFNSSILNNSNNSIQNSQNDEVHSQSNQKKIVQNQIDSPKSNKNSNPQKFPILAQQQSLLDNLQEQVSQNQNNQQLRNILNQCSQDKKSNVHHEPQNGELYKKQESIQPKQLFSSNP